MVISINVPNSFPGLAEASKNDSGSQSDSLSPSSSSSASSGDAVKGSPEEEEQQSDDNGGFVTPPPASQQSQTRAVKRATVVGNPMFSNSPDSDEGPVESLGLDDLDMDYEQIMSYFDNLKVGLGDVIAQKGLCD